MSSLNLNDICISFSVAPANVRLIGPSEARVGDSLNFECITENSNPPATIQWFVDNRTLPSDIQTTNTVTSPSGGWVTRSNISVMVSPKDRNKIIYCNAVNSELNDIKTQSHVLTVICKSFLRVIIKSQSFRFEYYISNYTTLKQKLLQLVTFQIPLGNLRYKA